MRAINHALTGAFIGLTIHEPLIAIPVAFGSHFICDMIPHYAYKDSNSDKLLRGKTFRNVLIADAALCFLLVLGLADRHPHQWLLAAVCAFLAASPDLLFIPRFLAARAHRKIKLNPFVQLTIDIQWFQRPIGAVVEVAWFIAGLIVLLPFLR